MKHNAVRSHFHAIVSSLFFTTFVFLASSFLAPMTAQAVSLRAFPFSYSAAACANIFVTPKSSQPAFGSNGPPKRDASYEWFPELRMKDLLEKQLRAKELSAADLRFLYQIEEPYNFTLIKDVYIFSIRRNFLLGHRDARYDLSVALGVRPSQISLNAREALHGGIKFHYGDLKVKSDAFDIAQTRIGRFRQLPARALGRKFRVLPEVVLGSLELWNFQSFENVVMPDSILDDLKYVGSYDFSTAVPPRYVRGKTSAEHHPNTSIIDGPNEIL